MISIQQFSIVKDRVVQERGELRLFVLILREGSPGLWDVVVSAPWADASLDEAIRYVSSVITSSVDRAQLLLVSRVVVLEEGNPVLEALLDASSTSPTGELRDRDFAGIEARQAFILHRPLLVHTI